MSVSDLFTYLYVRAALVARRQSGQGLVEYALILVLISIVSIAIMTLLGAQITNIFNTITNTLNRP